MQVFTVISDVDPAVETSTFDTPAESAPEPGRPPHRRRVILSCIAVAAAAVAIGVVAVSVIASDDHQQQPHLQHDVGDAKDHVGFGAGVPVREVTNLTFGIGDAKDHNG